MHFLRENFGISNKTSLKYVSIGSDNGLAPNRWQAIIWANVDPVLYINELIQVNLKIFVIHPTNQISHTCIDATNCQLIWQTIFLNTYSF